MSILTWEFSVLSSNPEDTKYTVFMTNDSLHPRLSLEPTSKILRISTIHQWVSAFNSFIVFFTEKKAAATAGLLKYAEVIRDIASKGGYWRYYDEQFCYLRQSKPTAFPWGQIHWELWFHS